MNFLTRFELAEQLKVHPKSISRFVREGRLECARVGRLQRFTPEHVAKFLRSEGR